MVFEVEFDDLEIPPRKNSGGLFKSIFWLVVSVSCVSLLIFWYVNSLDTAPNAFPANQIITVPEGVGAKEVAILFSEQNFVQSENWLYFSLIYWNDPSKIKAGNYRFEEPLTTRQIANELIAGHFATDLIKFTHIEGERLEKLSIRLEEKLPNFIASEFIELAKFHEGKLFPDTYLVPDTYNATQVFELLQKTFTEKLEPLQSKVSASKLTLDEIIILASIIEREANSEESKKMVAGILLNRLEIGMALQVDASIEYVLGKPLAKLTSADLETDTPYNTYLYPGLPPTPIGNPGLEAITAVLEPTKSDNFFYITGDDGVFYYAKNFDEHRVNIARHLR